VPALRELVARYRPTTTLWSHSYLPPVAWHGLPGRHVVEFANIEHLRSLSLARGADAWEQALSQRVEYLKGRVWEPRVMTRADAVIALSHSDAAVLATRARRVVTVPNGFPVATASPSPPNRTLGTIGSWGYSANLSGLRRFVSKEWPAIRSQVPGARLVVAGSGSEAVVERLTHDGSVTALGFVGRVEDFYASVSMVLAPATTGGGQQLKVTEALAHGRVVAGPRHVLHSVPDGLPRGAVVADDDVVTAVAALLQDHERRRRIERDLVATAPRYVWSSVVAPLLEVLT
jgi:glycosyltransferase involved in cell wall biosynthesis